MSKKSKLEDSLYDELATHHLPLPFRQYRFSTLRQWRADFAWWRADFAWPDRKIIVEIHGGLYMPLGRGAHNRGSSQEGNFEKENAATRAGWYVFRFGPKAIHRRKSGGTSQALAFLAGILK